MSVKIRFSQPPIGADVEFFFSKKGKVVGSEKVLEKKGLSVGSSNFIIDGVQAEINPRQSHCRELFAGEIKACWSNLAGYMKSKGVEIDFSPVVEVDKDEFDSLSESSKVFGCKPSYNEYSNAVSEIKVDPKKDMKRSAGGHIHLGRENITISYKGGMKEDCKTCPHNDPNNPEYVGCAEYAGGNVDIGSDINIHELDKLDFSKYKIPKDSTVSLQGEDSSLVLTKPKIIIPLLDLFVGIPSVLVDRDPNASIRRKVYGRAGEYRLPKYGIEYRTLSNFWMTSYPLMSLFTGLARMAQLTAAEEYHKEGSTAYIWEGIDRKDVERAINDSDFKLARQIFNKVLPHMLAIGDQQKDNMPINSDTILGFKWLVINGFQTWWEPNKVIQNWNDTYIGFERWASRVWQGEDVDVIKELFEECEK